MSEAGKLFVKLLLADLVLEDAASWFEEHVDSMSVQSTLYGRAASTIRMRLHTHLRFFSSSAGS